LPINISKQDTKSCTNSVDFQARPAPKLISRDMLKAIVWVLAVDLRV